MTLDGKLATFATLYSYTPASIYYKYGTSYQIAALNRFITCLESNLLITSEYDQFYSYEYTDAVLSTYDSIVRYMYCM